MKTRFYFGKIIGPLIGIFAGVYGVILGFIIGVLVDELIKTIRARKSVEDFLSRPKLAAHSEQNQTTKKLVAALGISITFVHGEGRAYGNWCKHLQAYMTKNSVLPYFKTRTVLDFFEDEHFPVESIYISELIEIFKDLATHEEALELTGLLFDLGTAEIRGLTGKKISVIETIAAGLDISRAELLELKKNSLSEYQEATRILGIGPDLSATEVKRIYKKLASQFHPDGATPLDAEQKKLTEEAFKRINWAYNTVVKEMREE